MNSHATLILVRHGKSEWNRENRFTGWTDIDLCDEGVVECREVARLVKERGIQPDVVFTSALRRAWRSGEEICRDLGVTNPTERSPALNERHYGALQGMNKEEAQRQFGEHQVHRWRRGFHERPPEGESLSDVVKRVVPYFERTILPRLREGKSVLVIAHGNSLRSLVKHLEGLGDDAIETFELRTGEPLFYHYDHNAEQQFRRH